jgi:nicotinamide mononucleotide transporter
VFYGAKLYSDTGLHIIYMFLQLYGWWNWRHNRDAEQTLIIEKGSLNAFLMWSAIALIGTVLLGATMSHFTDASFAYADAFTTSASLVAQFLLTRRYIYNWIFWIVVDVVAIFIYFQKGLLPTATLYFVFLIMSIAGYVSWAKQSRIQINSEHAQ